MKQITILFTLFIVAVSCGHRQSVVEQSLNEGWTLRGDTLDIDLPVGVPSVVQQNLYEAGLIPHPYLGVVEDQLLWISDHPWSYALNFEVDDQLLKKDVVELVFEGIDTYAKVCLNGEKLFDANNQFRCWKQDVKPLLKPKDNQLEVVFVRYDSTQRALYEQHQPRLPEKYAVSRKAPYQHGWDWAPKYKNIGIWKPVKLIGWSEARMENAYIVTNEANESQAKLSLHLDVESMEEEDLEVEVLLNGKLKQGFGLSTQQGNQHKVFSFNIENPKLWWPNEFGEQPLYDFEFQLKCDGKLLDSKKIRTGIKTVQLIQEPDEAGSSFYFMVNGQPIYAKGANYVPEEMIETWINPENTLKLLKMAQGAHFNMLRVWGGGIYPSDEFFNICDSLGIMVWEDFMYAGTMYPYDEDFLINAKMEALEQVKRLASHPSLALWCGGNEISEGYYNWGWQQSLGWTEEENQAIKAGYDRLFETILPTVVEVYDGTRPYWPSSPSKGWGRSESLTQGDVHYWGVWWGEQPYEMYRQKVGRFNSEYGYQSYPDYSTLQKIAQDEPLSIDAKVIEAHQKHLRGTRQIDDFIQKYFEVPDNFEEYVHVSQLSQAYGMEIAIEAHRTAKPYNMGTLYWQLNDAWPVVSWSSIDYYGNPKAFHERLKTLFAPVFLSFDQRDYQVYVVSDLLRNIDGVMTVTIEDFEGDCLYEQKVKVVMNANENRKYYVEGLRDFLMNSDLREVCLKFELNEGTQLLSERLCYLVAPNELIGKPSTDLWPR